MNATSRKLVLDLPEFVLRICTCIMATLVLKIQPTVFLENVRPMKSNVGTYGVVMPYQAQINVIDITTLVPISLAIAERRGEENTDHASFRTRNAANYGVSQLVSDLS